MGGSGRTTPPHACSEAPTDTPTNPLESGANAGDIGAMRAWMSWSSGKDSAFALHAARTSADLEVVALLTTVNETHARVAMHAVRESLLEAQAAALGLPLVKVPIPGPCSNEVYEARMNDAMARAREDGVRDVVFGDLYLEDIRAYRESKLGPAGMRAHFPLWKRPTAALAREMIDAGLEAIPHVRQPSRARRELRRAHVRRAAPHRPSGARQPVRRERRVPHLRLRRADVPRADPRRARRDRHARRLRLRGCPFARARSAVSRS